MHTMGAALNDLYNKRGSTREKALTLIIEGFTNNWRHQFAENNFATLLYRFLHSFKKGSSKEIILASHALGLLALTRGSGDNAHELYVESLPLLSQALKSRTKSILLPIIDCLAIITFVGGDGFEDTEKSMRIIWQFIHLESGSKNAGENHPASVLTTAISAWSFLLSTVEGWNLNYNHWKGAIPFFLDLLEVDDGSVCVAAVEALALICQVGSLKKFVPDTGSTDGSKIQKENDLLQHSTEPELQEKLCSHLKSTLEHIIDRTSVSSSKGCGVASNVLKMLKEGCFSETTLGIGKQTLKLCSFYQLLQVNFLKHFLGRGFVKHIQENKFLHEVFNFTPKMQTGPELYVAERQEVTLQLYVPEARKRDCEDGSEYVSKFNRSVLRKAKAQILNKQRAIKVKELSSFE